MGRKIVLASHCTLAKGLKETAVMIVGEMAQDIKVFSLEPGHHPDEFVEAIRSEIETNKEDEYVILTDIFGASVCTAMTQLLNNENVVLFSGMNLNLLLSVLVEYPNKLTEEDIERIICDAKGGIRNLSLSAELDDEDF